jgi:hypothetical protein
MLSLSAAGFLLAAALMLPNRDDDRAAAAAQTPPISLTPGASTRPVSLRDRLIVGLRAMRPSEVTYIDVVVARVHSGHLPQRLVDETFFWARERVARQNGDRDRRPMIYFQPALTARALRIGVEL